MDRSSEHPAGVSAAENRSEPPSRGGFRVRTFLRDLRGDLKLPEAAELTGVAKGDLSLIERGYLLPRRELVERLAGVYGDPAGWYPPTVAHALAPDPPACDRCGEPLPPSARANRKRHEVCP